jgi:hypothetical protein
MIKGGESLQGEAIGAPSEAVSMDIPREGDDSYHVRNTTM